MTTDPAQTQLAVMPQVDDQIKALTTSVREMHYREVVAQVNQITKTLPAVDMVRKTVPANIFYHHFLPFFRGDLVKESNHVERAERLMRHWMTIAGGPFNEVDVIGLSGEVIATVPKIYDNRAIQPVRIDVDIRRAVAMSMQDPLMQTASFMRILQNIGNAMPNTTADCKVDKSAWDRLFAVFEEKKTATEKTPAASVANGEDFELDF